MASVDAGHHRRAAPSAVADEAPVLVRLLGPVQAVVAGRPVAFPSPKARALFALLALEPGRTVPVGRLLEGLWGDDPPETATATLQAYVSRLRRVLDPDPGQQGRHPPPSRIRRAPPGYVLEVPAEAVDTQRFRRLSAAAEEQLDRDPLVAVELLDRALGLVRGEPLGDVVDQLPATAAAAAHRLAEEVLAARESHVDALLRADEAETALREAADLLAEHPLRERTQALHLLALYRCGRQADALTAFERFRRRLREELGVDPGPQLRRLHTRLLRQDADLELPSTPPASTPTPTGPATGRGPGDLTGREAPLGRLESALAGARAGGGSVWLVTGEAGIGRTAFCREVVRRARRRGLVTAWGRGQTSAGTTPYWLWLPVLRALPDLPGRSGADVLAGTSPGATSVPAASLPASRSHLHEGVAAALAERAHRQPLLVVLEDLQWADTASLELLGAVAETALDAPLVLLCTLRSPGPPAPPELTRLLARLAGTALQQVRLGGLPPQEARRLLTRRLQHPVDSARVEAAVARADGNPFFLVELARLLDERPAPADPVAGADVPATVLAVLHERLAPLAPGTRRLLEVAAVVGREAQLGLLERVGGLSPADLDAALGEAVETGFVTEQLLPTPRITFVHTLVREALYEGLRPVVRARLHAGVGTELASGRHDATADELAGHLLLGAEVVGPAAALPALLRASRRAAEQTALEHAERLLRQALVLTSRLPAGPERDGWELAVQSRLGSTVAVRSGWGSAEANRALQRAQHLALRSEPDVEMFAAVYHRLSWLTVVGGLDDVRTLGDVLLERSTATPGPTGRRFELLARMSRGAVRWSRGDDEGAVTELVRARQLAEDLGPDLLEAFREHPRTPVLGLLSQALAGAGRGREAWALSRRSLVLARQSSPAEAGGAVMFAGLLAAARQDTSAATALADELAELGRASGLDLHACSADVLGCWAAATGRGTPSGQAEAALVGLRGAVERYRATGARMLLPMVLVLLAEAELHRGQDERSRAALTAARAAGEPGLSRIWSQRLERLGHRLPPVG